MVAKKSKNNPDARGKKSVNYCSKCDTEKKPILIASVGKKKMCKECKCGAFDKQGVKVR